jgi:hypothetical protein
MVEPLAWRFTVRRGVEKVALLRESRTGTPKAVPRYGTTRDHQNHRFTLQVAPGSNRLSVRRLSA